MCRNAPRMLRSCLRPDMNSNAVAPLISAPIAATAIMVSGAAGSGCARTSQRERSGARWPSARRGSARRLRRTAGTVQKIGRPIGQSAGDWRSNQGEMGTPMTIVLVVNAELVNHLHSTFLLPGRPRG
jgi:hypothetical protein